MKFNNNILKILAAIIFTTVFAQAGFSAIATDAKLQYNKGIDYFKLGQLDQAAQSFKQAIDLDPNYIDAYYNLGSILEYLQQDEAALTVFKQIILRKPDDYEAVLKAAEISAKLGEIEKAQMYLTLIPKDSMPGQKATQLENQLKSRQQAQQHQQSQENSAATAQTAQARQNQASETAQNPETIQEAQPQVQEQPKVAEQTQDEPQQEEAAIETPQKEVVKLEDKVFTDIISPTGIVTDNSGNLYVAGFSDNTIYKINKDNQKLVYIKSEKIDGPIGIAMDSDGNIYIANYNKDNILKVDTNGQITELLKEIAKPYCIFISNDVLYTSAQGSNSVIRRNLKK